VRALLLDFNGTISDDEPLLCRIFIELFSKEKPLSEREYYERLAGLADREIVRVWLGRDDPALVERKIERYGELADGTTVTQESRDAVEYAAGRAAVAVVSGSARAEIEPVLVQTGLMESIAAIVASDDIRRSKPDPEGYLIALHVLGVTAAEAAAVEDSPAGVQAAKSAGLYCAAVTTTLPAERLSAADEIADRFDRDLIAGLLSRK
jgi:beta-phosphoglucomutase-like phosphatase (HAD superfamily)